MLPYQNYLSGKEICEGAVTRELTTVVKICENGKLRLKKKSDIAPGWPKAGGGEGQIKKVNKMEDYHF